MDTIRTTSLRKARMDRCHFRRSESIAHRRIVLCIVILLVILGARDSYAQGVGISESSITPHASAILELRSVSRGFLLPRLATGDISSPAQGLLIYNTGTNNLSFYDGTAWTSTAALDVSITPTWTGAHKWSALGTFNLGLNASGAVVNVNANSNFATNINTGTSTGAVTVGGTGVMQIDIGAGGTGTKTINIGGTSADVIAIGNTQTTGSIAMGAAMTGGTITIGGTGAQTGAIGLGTGTGAQTLNLGTGATAAKTINIGTGAVANTITMGNVTGATAVNINTGTGASTFATTGAGTLVIGGAASTGALTLGSSSAAQTVNVGTGAGLATVNIANGLVGSAVSIANGINTVAQSVDIGAGANAANNTINIGSGTNTAGVTAVTIGTNTNFANTTLIEGGNGTGAISLTPQTTGTIVIGDPAGTGAITVGSSSAAQTLNLGTGAGAGAVNVGSAASTMTIGSRENTIGVAWAANGDGVRFGTGRITSNMPTAPTTGLNVATTATVAQVLNAGIIGFAATAARVLTLPSAQGAAGLVQNLPGTPAVGDIFTFVVFNTGAFNVTLAAGAGITIVNTTPVNARTRTVCCRVTGVTAGAETISVY